MRHNMTIPNPSDEVDRLRGVIGQFLQERLQPKLDKVKADDQIGREALATSYRPENWLDDAAIR